MEFSPIEFSQIEFDPEAFAEVVANTIARERTDETAFAVVRVSWPAHEVTQDEIHRIAEVLRSRCDGLRGLVTPEVGPVILLRHEDLARAGYFPRPEAAAAEPTA